MLNMWLEHSCQLVVQAGIFCSCIF
jgi:hypothetical protein